MALVDLFLANRPKLGHIELDCTVSESHAEGVRRSPYPVEDGAERTDHVEDLPPEVVLEGLISDVAPVGFAGVDFVSGLFSDARSAAAWAELVALKRSNEPFILSTSLDVYPRMVFADGQSLTVERDRQNSTTLRFRAHLVRDRVAYTTTAEALAAAVRDLAEVTASSGLQSASAADPTTAAAAAGAV